MAPRTQTNNPLERTPPKVTGSLQTKTGAGVKYEPRNRVGPDVQVPAIALAAQSAAAKSLEAGAVPPIHGGDVPTRPIDREGLSQEQNQLYGRT
jgi:hypothetical protein